ncbi:MAG TPA: ABC transporter ATP-binding protein [Solirubrobacterales bacterium]|nr:ABC transporter ATP-binding protein [Solirubrobacterales bacterium]
MSAEVPLRGFDLDLALDARPGAPLALVGPSGSGKSSALRVIAGLLSPRVGRVTVGEETWLDSERGVEVPAERRRCGLVFQDYALFPRMSALRNVAYGIGGRRPARRAAALAMLERFGVAHLADACPGALSGGERQRIALARALAARPRVLLLDEPLSALDTTTRHGALAELRSVLAELDAPTVLVTHSFDEAALLSESMAILDRGAVVQRGTAAEISARPASPFVADFAGAVVLRGEAAAEPGGLTLVRLEGGGEVRSIDAGRGLVAISVFPWEISLESPGGSPRDSVLNRVGGEVVSVTTIGNRARIGVSIPQSISTEITARSAAAMGLQPGTRVTAAWKASATRLIALR